MAWDDEKNFWDDDDQEWFDRQIANPFEAPNEAERKITRDNDKNYNGVISACSAVALFPDTDTGGTHPWNLCAWL